MGGFTAEKSYITALSWASLRCPPPQDTPAQSHRQAWPQGRDQLLLFSGSSDGCVRLHAQSVEALGAAELQSQGQLLQGGLMPLSKTLHPADLLSVTCLAVKSASSVQTGSFSQSVVQTHCPVLHERLSLNTFISSPFSPPPPVLLANPLPSASDKLMCAVSML